MDIKDIVRNIMNCFEDLGPYLHIYEDSYLPDMLACIAEHKKDE